MFIRGDSGGKIGSLASGTFLKMGRTGRKSPWEGRRFERSGCLLWFVSTQESYLIAFPICLSNLHLGAMPSSAQYSSTATILPLITLMKDVT